MAFVGGTVLAADYPLNASHTVKRIVALSPHGVEMLFAIGAGDMIVHTSQAEYFRQRIKNLRLEIFKNCGHAPHLSDVEKMRKIILEEVDLAKIV